MTAIKLRRVGRGAGAVAGFAALWASISTRTRRVVIRRSARVLMVIENAGMPSDRRVWNESRTLQRAGWEVVVVCPQSVGADQPPVEVLDGVAIHRYPLRPAASAIGYVREYVQALWRIRRLARRLQREAPFDVVHTANPPDFLYLATSTLRRRGASFIFDHHDLSPELFSERYGRAGLVRKMLLALERRALRAADVVISTNESVRQLVIERSDVAPEDIFVVRNGPDLGRFRSVAPEPELRRGRAHLIAYVGVMGPQDGIDHALGALAELRRLREDDWRAVFIGDGDVIEPMKKLSRELGLDELVEFAGWRRDGDICRALSTADVCLAPDPPGPLNDLSTMVKVPEYMAMGCAIASYELLETRVSAGDAAAYADAPTPASLGRCVHELLEDPHRRRVMGELARKRVAALSWERSSERLLEAYERATADSSIGRSRGLPNLNSSGVSVGNTPDSPSHELR